MPIRILSFDVGLRHLAYAVVVADEETEDGVDPVVPLAPVTPATPAVRLERWGVIDVAEHAPGGSSSSGVPKKKGPSAAEDTIVAIVAALDAEFYDPGRVRYDFVLVENQPTLKNPTMKSVQVAIHTYFVTMGAYAGCVGAVRLVSATRKLVGQPPVQKPSAPTDQPEGVSKAKKDRDAYKARKAQSIELCRAFLRDAITSSEGTGGADPSSAARRHLAMLEKAKKKDDLADALLQAVWFTNDRREQQRLLDQKEDRKQRGKGSKPVHA
jgi:hypothetical protein